MKDDLVKLKLETLKQFQDNHPTSHVGGSIGLMLRGIDLKRDLRKSDLDITIDEYEFNVQNTEGLIESSDRNDFDLNLLHDHGKCLYTKIDLRINPEPSFDVVEYNGVNYNVSKLRDILFWKKKYADKKYSKHIDDLVVIKTGKRPVHSMPSLDLEDDLPF